ncbi:MAG: universal stress protein [Ignavibacteriae bacterium]|nr:universal stress protein [Ignavibacteriota bacterium]
MKKPSPKKRATHRPRKKVTVQQPTVARPSPETSAPAPQVVSSLPIRHILVPIDFSIHSKNALRYAVPMAEQYKAKLHLIYVIEPTVYPADLGFGQVIVPGVEEELRTKSEDELRLLIENEIGGRADAEHVVRTGKPHQEILTEAEEKSADLIIVATHGHTGVEQMLFGSTAMRIVRLARCPVLTIRPQVED